MRGEVHAVNAELGLVAIETRNGFTVFEQTGTEFAEGEFVDWTSEEPLGRHEARNLSRGKSTWVYFLNHRVPATFLKVNLKA